MTGKDLENLEKIFALARMQSVHNEDDMMQLIAYKKELFKRINKIIDDNTDNGTGSKGSDGPDK